jgi:ABC-type Mn2+/Zn2+ transport system permease subunit
MSNLIVTHGCSFFEIVVNKGQALDFTKKDEMISQWIRSTLLACYIWKQILTKSTNVDHQLTHGCHVWLFVVLVLLLLALGLFNRQNFK